MKAITMALVVLASCGDGYKRVTSEEKNASAELLRDVVGEDGETKLQRANIDIILKSDKPIECNGVKAWGCTIGYYEDYTIDIGGNADGCLFRWDLAHELLHVVICENGHCDPEHHDKMWLSFGGLEKEAINAGCIN